MILNSRLMTQIAIAVGLDSALIKVVHAGLEGYLAPLVLRPQPLASIGMKRFHKASESAPAFSSGRV
jgi:di/tripeptidase